MHEDAWLAARLGRPCFTLDDDDDPAPLSGAGFWQAKVEARDVARGTALEDAGLRVIDVNVTLRREPAVVEAARACDVGPAHADEHDAVVAIARADYDVSRFHLDPQIPGELAAAL